MLTPAPTAICIFGQLTLLAAVDDIAVSFKYRVNVRQGG